MKKFIFGSICFVNISLFGQVGVGVSSPDNSAMLEINSSNKGLLIPRINLNSVNDATTIPNPAQSILVYHLATSNTSTITTGPGFYYNAGTSTNPEWALLSKLDHSSGVTVTKKKYLGTVNENQILTNGSLSFRFIQGATDNSPNQPYRIQMRVNKLPNGVTVATYRTNRIDFYSTLSNTQEVNITFSQSDVDSGIWKNISSHSGYSGTHSNLVHIGCDEDPTLFYKLSTQERYNVFWSMAAESY
ncbi:hypothetical protein M9991_17025 [Chryseobacterium gallinarum]|uniref:hypothetical protein n=1 Tax=Chryseobacterium gallinarum TaxID=1324352 RepID=UPI0020257507|nr:hypothetical protein [Chryseobacterium gallinarum]MCL8538572.1 hypothetical protein [Chryseobacterium gallinarum]